MRGTLYRIPVDCGGTLATMTRGFQIVMAQPEDTGSMLRIQALVVRAITEGVFDASL